MVQSQKETDFSTSKDYDREAIARKARAAADSVKDLIMSIGMNIENKIAIEDQINHLSHETESMLSRIDDVSRANQKKLLLAYKKFLEHNLAAVNHRLKEPDSK
ncbi:MAG: hypothetical protein ABI361_04335 [Nitrososphaera sp.]|jgi:hypothetical protein